MQRANSTQYNNDSSRLRIRELGYSIEKGQQPKIILKSPQQPEALRLLSNVPTSLCSMKSSYFSLG